MRFTFLSLSLLVACSSSTEREDEDRDRDGVSGLLDASFITDATRPSRREDARVDAGAPWLASASAEACNAALGAPDADLCGSEDPSEPNDARRPARIDVEPHCGLVLGQAADKDEDAYRFSTPRADPVLVELSYRDGLRADLGFKVQEPNGRLVARRDAVRKANVELEATTFMSAAASEYDVHVEGKFIGQCVPYALRIDSNWCTDAYEDNDSAPKASQLDLRGVVEIQATGSRFESDYYAFSPSKADPVLVSGRYEASASSNLQMRRVLSNVTGLSAFDDPGARVGTSESWEHWLRSDTPSYIVQIAPTGDGCMRYTLRLDPFACTDASEDNDSLAAAKPLSIGQDLEARAFLGDDDFYALPELASGRCTVRYTATGAQQLRLDVHSNNAGVIASSIGTLGAGQQRVEVSWSTPGAIALQVRAQLGESCQPYTLRCTP